MSGVANYNGDMPISWFLTGNSGLVIEPKDAIEGATQPPEKPYVVATPDNKAKLNQAALGQNYEKQYVWLGAEKDEILYCPAQRRELVDSVVNSNSFLNYLQLFGNSIYWKGKERTKTSFSMLGFGLNKLEKKVITWDTSGKIKALDFKNKETQDGVFLFDAVGLLKSIGNQVGGAYYKNKNPVFNYDASKCRVVAYYKIEKDGDAPRILAGTIVEFNINSQEIQIIEKTYKNFSTQGEIYVHRWLSAGVEVVSAGGAGAVGTIIKSPGTVPGSYGKLRLGKSELNTERTIIAPFDVFYNPNADAWLASKIRMRYVKNIKQETSGTQGFSGCSDGGNCYSGTLYGTSEYREIETETLIEIDDNQIFRINEIETTSSSQSVVSGDGISEATLPISYSTNTYKKELKQVFGTPNVLPFTHYLFEIKEDGTNDYFILMPDGSRVLIPAPIGFVTSGNTPCLKYANFCRYPTLPTGDEYFVLSIPECCENNQIPSKIFTGRTQTHQAIAIPELGFYWDDGAKQLIGKGDFEVKYVGVK